MEEDEVSEARLAALCSKLGTLWSGSDLAVIDGAVSNERLQECRLTMLGQLFSNPTINFQAFQSTMKKAWRVDSVNITQEDQRTFAFTFKTELELKRVLEAGAWSFSNNLVVLKTYIPDVPLPNYEFTHCDFWVQVHGLPLNWTSEESIRRITAAARCVSDVRTDPKASPNFSNGKAKVKIDLAAPLKPGTIASQGGRKLWVDFRYERLPHFCYACGRIGHYAKFCEVKHYDENRLETDEPGCFGLWLRAESREWSPLWKSF
ncbi:uncharacterized protein LOC130136051 [Syzygium oleosum]|uniref:uncharacterized protein LOC130136051 n=1 Tax=Syzygium oleosum TaxID=219896 RepID=UPI0024BA7166|nr:uncharacterized protein LOC130136051 [Syzygium oleosum]